MKITKLLLGFSLLITNFLFSQTLTISSTGETGTSGTGWSISGSTLTVTAAANISASVLTNAMTSNNLTILPSTGSNFSVIVDEAITSTTPGSSLTIGSSSPNTGIIDINAIITVDGAINLYGQRVSIDADISTTNTTSGNIFVRATENSTSNPAPISGNGNISVAAGKDLTFENNGSATTSVYGGTISGVNSRFWATGSGTIVLTQNNLYTGNTVVTGNLILRNDAPNPASKTFTGSKALRIEPASTSFTSTFSTNGYTFPSTLDGITIGKTNNDSDVTIDGNILISGTTIIHCNTLNLNGNISATNGSGRFVQIYCKNPLINVTGSRTITATSIFGIYAPAAGFTTDLIFPIPNLTCSGALLYLGGSNNNKNVVINSNYSFSGVNEITGDKILLNGNLTNNSTSQGINFVTNELVVSSPRTITTQKAFSLVQKTAFVSDIVFPGPNLTVSCNGLTIGTTTNTKNITITTDLSYTTGNINLYGANLVINGNLSGNDLTVQSNQITLNGNVTCSGSVNFNSASALIVPSPITFSTGGNFNLYTLSGPFNYDLIFPIPNLALTVGNTMQLGGMNNTRNITVNGNISIPGQIMFYCGNLTLNNNLSNTNGNGIIFWCNNLSIPTPISLSTNGMVQINPRTSGTAFTSLIDLTNLSILNTSTSGLSIGNSNNSTNGITLGNLTIPGTINLNIGGSININGDVKNTVGNFTLRGTTTVAPGKNIQCAGNFTQNGNITFKSDATGTAAFGTLGGTYTTSGTVTVERYIPARRAFRFLSPSVTTTTSIKVNWQNNGTNTAGLGTHITGTGGATNGFDVTATNNPSLFTFTNGAWSAVTNTNVNVLTAGTPYRLMVRGDRTTDLTSNTSSATATTLRATGTLKTGNFTPTLNQSADGFSLIGNPYQAPIDIKAILTASTNMSSNVVYYWDPTLNARGGYVTRDLTTDVNDVTSSFNQYVQPGQAVFVKKDNTANVPTMTITEANKSVANAAAGVFRNSNTSTDFGLLRVNLQANNQTIEGALALFDDNYTWNVTSEDATKMSNLDEEVSFVQNNTNLAIALQSNPSATSELPIKIDKMRHTNYQWQFELNNYSGATPYLFDTLNNSYTQINNGTVVPFTVDLNTTNRFKIVFQNSALSTDDFANNIKLYPNPAKAGASFYVDGITEATVTVYNLLGQTVPVQTKNQGTTLQVTPNTNLSQGVYLVNITKDDTTKQVKWIVE